MNIHIENRNYWGNKRILKCIFEKITRDETVKLFLISESAVSWLHIFLLANLYKRVRSITVILPVEKLSHLLVAFANRNDALTIQLRVTQHITKRQWKKLLNIKGALIIQDASLDEDNITRYQATRNIIFKAQQHNTCANAGIYNLAAGNITECEYSSCLGRNLYIAKDNVVSFCPKRPKDSFMGDITSTKRLWENVNFQTALQDMIDRRAECRAACSLYDMCKSGCYFWKDCKGFVEAYRDAQEDISSIISRNEDLALLPLSKEYAVLYSLFRNNIE